LSTTPEAQKNQSDKDIVERILVLQEIAGTTGFKFFEVTYPEELEAINIDPPAIAYVRKVGDFYMRHDPSYWFGAPGTPAKWIRSAFSGGQGMIRATEIGYLSGIAQSKLSQLIREGTRNFNSSNYSDYASGGFWSVAKQLWLLAHNFNLVELNERTAGDQGDMLYDIYDGDIVVENNSKAYCVQNRTRTSGKKIYKRDLIRLGMKPLVQSTPGIHVQKRVKDRADIKDTHEEPIGYIVNKNTIPKGATSFYAAIYPGSVPRPETGNGKAWEAGSDWFPNSEPDVDVVPPSLATQTDKPWSLRNFAWIQAPYETAKLAVTNYSAPSPGITPVAFNASITLEQGCPIPLTSILEIKTDSKQSWYVGPPDRDFSVMPLGQYGGGLNQTTLSIRVLPRSFEYIDIGSDQEGPLIGENRLSMYKSWINAAGKRRFSYFRGITKDDLIVLTNNSYMYGISEVKKNKLQNPTEIILSEGLKENIGRGRATLDGIWIANVTPYWVNGLLPEEPVVEFRGWEAPDGNKGIPMIIKSINNTTVNLMAPVAEEIPAGTKMKVWASKDVNTVTYAYYDFYDFIHSLEQYLLVTEDIGRANIVAKMTEVSKKLEQLDLAKEKANKIGGDRWYRKPYYVNTLLDNYLPAEFQRYGGTFLEAQDKFGEILTGLGDLWRTKPPTWNNVEYTSLINYVHNTVGGK